MIDLPARVADRLGVQVGTRKEIDLDAIAHDPRVGYPRMTDEQLAELIEHDRQRLARIRLVQRPGRIDWSRTRYFAR